jgi:hypothetical protein
LPEGKVFTLSAGNLFNYTNFQITYQGGASGHDVVLTTVNVAPTFVKGSDLNATDEDGPRTLSGWASNLSPGPLGEANQQLHFAVTGNTNPALFAAGPSIDADGTLKFTPAPNAHGSADITLVLMDNGGTANGGVDTSGSQTFAINIAKPHPWHNVLNALDVTGSGGQPDGIVAPGDALAIINYINAFGAGSIPVSAAPGAPYLDTTGGAGHGDNAVVAGDALAVINYINAFGAGLPGPAGEGEATGLNQPLADKLPSDLIFLLAADIARQGVRRHRLA